MPVRRLFPKMADKLDRNLVAQLKREVEARMIQKEAEVTEYWLARLTEVLGKRHSGLASLQVDIKNLQGKMRNRVRALRSGEAI